VSDIVKAVEKQAQKPWKSPTYPQRVHVRERAHWEGVLRHWDAKIAHCGAELGPDSSPARQRMHVQMRGARDQIADAVRRLPLEVGDLYEEDKHRLEEAVAALERLVGAWPYL
jgi:hypothetical protein